MDAALVPHPQRSFIMHALFALLTLPAAALAANPLKLSKSHAGQNFLNGQLCDAHFFLLD
jgi:hypothetical protein